METILSYILKVMIIQMALFAIFLLLNRNNTNFQFNRFFLITSLILPFLIPFIEIPIHLGNYQITNTFYPKEIDFEEYSPAFNVIQPQEIDSTDINWLKILTVSLYAGISLIFVINMIRGFWQIKKLRRRSRFSEITPKGYLMHLIPSEILSFSFFREIFLSNQFRFRSYERKAIIAHEEFHISQGHSFDIILSELVRTVFWFNPIIYLIQKYLRQNHEFQTDLHIGNQYDTTTYKNLLRSHQWKEFNLLLGNSISGSSINKRIKMMEKSTQSPMIYRSLITSISALLIFFAFACQESLESTKFEDQGFQFVFTNEDLESEIQRTITINKNAPKEAIELYESSQRSNPQYRYSLMVQPIFENQKSRQSLEEIKETWENMRQLEYNVEYLRYLNDDEFNHFYKQKTVSNFSSQIIGGFVMIRKVDRLKEAEQQYKMSSDEEIHDDYDKPATIGNGESDMNKLIYDRLVYPSAAKEKGIEDKVVLKFVVTKAGGLVYLNFDKFPNTKDDDISLEFQKSAFQAVKATEGKWNPAEKNGRYVLSWKTVPVEFKLED